MLEEVEGVLDAFFDEVEKKFWVVVSKANEEIEEQIRSALKREFELIEPFELLKRIEEMGNAKSLFSGKSLAEQIGIELFTEFHYSLERLEQSAKMMFNYALKGRRGKEGILHRIGGFQVGKAVVMVPSEKERAFERFLRKWEVKYERRKVIYKVLR